MSTIYTDLAAAVGNTPLIRLNAASEATGCEILVYHQSRRGLW